LPQTQFQTTQKPRRFPETTPSDNRFWTAQALSCFDELMFLLQITMVEDVNYGGKGEIFGNSLKV